MTGREDSMSGSDPRDLGGTHGEYDPHHHVVYLRPSGAPNTPGCVAYSEVRDGLLYDIGHDGKIVGIEALLDGPLEVWSGAWTSKDGSTRTSFSGQTIIVQGSSSARDIPPDERSEAPNE